jgi:hypothetical protein
MPARTLTLVALTSAPLLAQATWTTVPIVPAEQVHRPSVALGDIDGDRIDDLVLGRNGVIVVRRGTRGAPDRQFADREQPLPARVRHMPAPVAVGPSCESAGQPRLHDVDRDGDLDIVAIDADLGGGGHVVWFANDGRGTFAAARELTAADGQRLEWRRALCTVDLADVDNDGHLDLLVGTGATGLRLHRGSAEGFAEDGRDLGVQTRETAVLVDWDGDAATDLLYVDDGAVVLQRRTGDGYEQPERLADVEGGMVQLSVADWNGDGRVDLMLGETLPQKAPPVAPEAAAEAHARRQAAQRVLDVVQQEIGRLNAAKPPLGDPVAMADRKAWREQLGRWAEGPRALVEAPRLQNPAVPGGRLRVLVRR